jgi:hypothetical protein
MDSRLCTPILKPAQTLLPSLTTPVGIITNYMPTRSRLPDSRQSCCYRPFPLSPVLAMDMDMWSTPSHQASALAVEQTLIDIYVLEEMAGSHSQQACRTTQCIALPPLQPLQPGSQL